MEDCIRGFHWPGLEEEYVTFSHSIGHNTWPQLIARETIKYYLATCLGGMENRFSKQLVNL